MKMEKKFEELRLDFDKLKEKVGSFEALKGFKCNQSNSFFVNKILPSASILSCVVTLVGGGIAMYGLKNNWEKRFNEEQQEIIAGNRKLCQMVAEKLSPPRPRFPGFSGMQGAKPSPHFSSSPHSRFH